MVGCVYKVISKVLVGRMRSVMLGLIGETQRVFVKGQKIHDGTFIPYETVHWLKIKKKEAAVEAVGYGVCYTSFMSILINDSPTKPFKMERGLRKGDPLSPFLFVLVVDVLNRMIEVAVRNGRISPIFVGRDNIELSHFQ
ncbi:uncharacterized mitochondrial protein AtMg01250-like [Arachis hypogaea]|uniref:uncharacterized mitochondrial protein AtMg01250-like n=1 Tax=Arachis hypogaea TaxID=3818 RepID=UPI000DECCB47|nr:uncharacterized protein LOC112724672 [Arachis hypogaea]